MKTTILSLLCFCCTLVLHAQVNMSIGSGAYFIVSGATHVVMDTGNFHNDGTYIDSSGMFKATGGVTFNGSGTTRFNNLAIDNAQHSLVNSEVSVYNTANLVSGNLDANNQLYIRSDANTIANMVVSGVLTNQVKGLVTRASATSGTGCTPYTSDLSLNISGPAMVYQWQSSPDSTMWSDVSGATASTYTASVTATVWYRCNLSTNNSTYSQSTPGVRLYYTGALPAIAGPLTVCTGANALFTNATAGGTWSSSNPAKATIDAGTGIAAGISGGSTIISYATSPTCYRVTTLTVIPSPLPIAGPTEVCEGLTAGLTNLMGSGTWSSSNTGVAVIGSTSGILTGISAGTSTITYTLYTGCTTVREQTVNMVPAPVTGTATVCAGSTTLLSTTSTGGTWVTSHPAVATVNSATGEVTGVTGGNATIRYMTPTGCNSAVTVTVNNLPMAITGTLSLCPGGSNTLGSPTSGGTWSSLTPGTAVIGASTGIVTGIAPGIATISYTIATGCARTAEVTVNALPPAISGSADICIGSTSALTNSVSGGTWTSSSTSTATVGLHTGIVTAMSAGTANITYKVPGAGCFSTLEVTVMSTPAAITGTTNFCVTATTTLSHPVSGGTWSSSNTAVGTVDASTGEVTGISVGTARITYTVSPGCFRWILINVQALPVLTTTGAVCEGATTAIGYYPTGGTWASSSTANATVNTTGVVTGVSAGTTIISYTKSPGCMSTREITVNPIPDVITGSTAVCIGSTTTLSSAPGGGTWTSSAVARATVGSSSGIVTGISAGNVSISYIAAGCRRTITVTVGAMPAAITGTPNVCAGSTTTLASTPAGGTWESSNTAAATIPGSGAGIVTGLSAGTTVISYTRLGCVRMATVTVNPALTSITGDLLVCAGNTSALSNPTGGGTWSSSLTAKATINTSTGLMAGVSAGSTTITYRTATTCFTTAQATVNAALTGITGTTNVCVGSTTALAIAASGGTWSSSNTAKATVDMVSGVVTGISTGTAVISYTQSTGCYKTATVVVQALPAAIGGTASVCVGLATSLTNTTGGGTWSSSNTSIATVTSGGAVSGVTDGTATITYRLSTGCQSTRDVTVNPLPAVISGTTPICAGTTNLFSSAPGGGTWTSSTPSVATVGSASGIVTALISGATTLSYTLPTGCRRTLPVPVNPMPNAITGTASVFVGLTTTLSSSTSGGTWTSGDMAIATVGSATGVVNGIDAGTATITYQLTSTGCYRTRDVTVNFLASDKESLSETSEGKSGIFTVYPNPSTGALHIKTDVNGVFAVYALDGKQVEQYAVTTTATSITLPNTLAAGVYMCRFTGEDGSVKMVRLVYNP